MTTEVNRRTFMTVMGATVAESCLPALAEERSGPTGDASSCLKPSRLSVTWEWGALREAVVGCPWARIPTALPRFWKNFMSPDALAFAKKVIREHPGEPLPQAAPELYEAMASQMDQAIALLRHRGVIIHQTLPLVSDEEAFLADFSLRGASQAFTRDPIVVIGERLIETAMYAPMRRKERFAIRRTIGKRLEMADADVFSISEPPPGPEGPSGYPPGAYLEGGDVFVLGRDIYVGLTGNASSLGGVRSLRAILQPQYRIHQVRLSRKFLHLDCVLATVRPGLAIVCKEGFIDGLPSFLRGWKLIEVSATDAEESLATNVLVIDERTTMVASETPAVADALAKAGQEVITTPFSAVFLWGGAFRCWHHPLVRE
jgi:N-dimethylarginine dimethylaminohydrolase